MREAAANLHEAGQEIAQEGRSRGPLGQRPPGAFARTSREAAFVHQVLDQLVLHPASIKIGASAFRSRCLPCASRDATVGSGVPVAREIARLV